MNRFKKRFPHSRHVVLPVIHSESLDQSLRNARVARDEGCDGVFLINHGMSSGELLQIADQVCEEHSDWWIGVNCLDLDPEETFRAVTAKIQGIWVDNALIDERSHNQKEAKAVLKVRKETGWQGLYFGGVAFKYQRHVEELALAARIAAGLMDVVTTSGPGTGQAAERQKIAAMKGALGQQPLAIASGITPENVGDYLDVADCFLVATGISQSFTELDPGRVKALIQAVRSYVPLRSVCFICEWNEGRSAHLELSVRHKLREQGSQIRVTSAGLSQGGGINSQRSDFLYDLGIPAKEIDAHYSTLFNEEHAACDLVLVTELQMKERILADWPELRGKVMTVRGFVQGYLPHTGDLSARQAHIEDAGGHSPAEKQVLYVEIEKIAEGVAKRLLAGS